MTPSCLTNRIGVALKGGAPGPHWRVTQGIARCALGSRCAEARALLAHVLKCGDNTGPYGAIRRLVLHYISCSDPACAICSEVWDEVATGPQSTEPSPVACPGEGADPPPMSVQLCSKRPAPPSPSLTPTPTSGLQAGPAALSEADKQLLQAVRHGTWLIGCALHRPLPGGSAPTAYSGVQAGHALWRQILGEDTTGGLTGGGGSGSGGGGGSHASKQLVLHRLECERPGCPLCGPICGHFSRCPGSGLPPPPPPQCSATDGALFQMDALAAVVHQISALQLAA